MDLDYNINKYLQNRELGFRRNCYGFKQNISENLIEKMRCTAYNMNNLETYIGSTFCCKFSKNKNNLHMVACSTDHGEIIIQNTLEDNEMKGGVVNILDNYKRAVLHDNAIFNLAWAEPNMKLVTASADQTSKIIQVLPSGKMELLVTFNYNSSVKSVMFCPGSSDVFCGGSQDGSIKVWDTRVNNNRFVINCLGLEHHIPNAHGVYTKHNPYKRAFKSYGISSVIYQNDLSIISCSSNDPAINVWDLRKSYRQVKGNTESLPLKKYYCSETSSHGFIDIHLNPQSSLLYASRLRDSIFCFSLDSAQRTPIHCYSGHCQETSFSKISISHDGRYIFSGCTNNTGVIWTTELPHIEKPIFILNKKLRDPFSVLDLLHQELSVSDWCADPTTHPKLVTSSDSIPLLWSVTKMQVKTSYHKFIKTQEGKTKKMFLNSTRTVPIKLNTELKEKFGKETGNVGK
ncbi:Hypothetical protein CINCED_3A012480 [Cinara cedri]|uniref:Uncharacterized protein n=1 Tax=Cinara cedri TaxID=506608 RepID=A0A5E4MWX6_9HEMI|nr:Hypothetical protein CINCED_3A012480 [Cinara cedri]